MINLMDLFRKMSDEYGYCIQVEELKYKGSRPRAQKLSRTTKRVDDEKRLEAIRVVTFNERDVVQANCWIRQVPGIKELTLGPFVSVENVFEPFPRLRVFMSALPSAILAVMNR